MSTPAFTEQQIDAIQQMFDGAHGNLTKFAAATIEQMREQRRLTYRIGLMLIDAIEQSGHELATIKWALVTKGLLTGEELVAAEAELAAGRQVERALDPDLAAQAEELRRLMREVAKDLNEG